MSRTIHVIGNGDNAQLFDPRAKGARITCNLPPFPVHNVFATCIVDFKMMRAMSEGSVQVPGDWVLGMRPKHWLEVNPSWRLRWHKQIKEFYTVLPEYTPNYTDFNCGHMAAHYACNRLKADTVHMYGFDSIFDQNLRSCTDFYLNSDRSNTNNYRLAENWRPVWANLFNEFPDTQFVLYHKHNNIKLPLLPANVAIRAQGFTK